MASFEAWRDFLCSPGFKYGRCPYGRWGFCDGSERFLVDEAMLLSVSALLGGEFIEPIKTTVVQNQRAMTTWCLRKP